VPKLKSSGTVKNNTAANVGYGAEPWRMADALRRLMDAANLEQMIIPIYYRDRQVFLIVMYGAIALTGAFLNTQRIIQQHMLKAYL
jgi:uncharacterized protein (UPF0303 family)